MTEINMNEVIEVIKVYGETIRTFRQRRRARGEIPIDPEYAETLIAKGQDEFGKYATVGQMLSKKMLSAYEAFLLLEYLIFDRHLS